MKRMIRRFALLGLVLAPLGSPGELPRRARRPAASASRLTPAQCDAVMHEHNAARNAVGVGPLYWSEELSGYAQDWADRLAATSCEIHHRADMGHQDGKNYGENLAGQGISGAEMNLDLAQGVRDWVSEKKFFHDKPLGADWHPAGHYTQVVWRDTRRVGCGLALCRKGEWQWRLLVCNYDPPGNVMGRKPY